MKIGLKNPIFKKWLLGIFIFLMVSNYVGIFRTLCITNLGGVNLSRFMYSTRNQELNPVEETEWMMPGNRTFEEITTYHVRYKECHPTHPDPTLYRRFSMKWWHFWNWFNYFTHPRWRLPYLAKEDTLPRPEVNTPSVCAEPE